MRLGSLLDDLAKDVLHTLRDAARTPGFLLSVLALACAIGATVAAHGTIRWLLHSATGGVVDPDRVVVVDAISSTDPGTGRGLSYPMYEALEDVQDGFVEIATYAKFMGVVASDVDTDQVVVEYVSGDYFPLLGVVPAAGRLIGPEDDVEGAAPAVVISHRYWRGRFNGDESIVGRTVLLNGQRVRVVGVAGRRFDGYSNDWNGLTDVWGSNRTGAQISAGMRQLLGSETASYFRLVGRMQDDVGLEALRERTAVWFPALPELIPTLNVDGLRVTPSSEKRISRRVEAGSFLGPLRVVSVLILLGACFGIATFMLDRTLARRYDLALRSALGATRMRLLRQLATEAVVIGIAASVLGLGVGALLARVLSAFTGLYLELPPYTLPIGTEGAVNPSMVVFSLGLGLAAAMLFGCLPAIRSFRDPLAALKRYEPAWSWSRLRVSPEQGVLMLQVGLSVALAIAAASYGRSFMGVAAIDPGLEAPESVLVVQTLPAGLTRPEAIAFHEALLERARAMPTVRAAGTGGSGPFALATQPALFDPTSPADTLTGVRAAAAGSGMFAAEGVPLVAGRAFGRDDLDRRDVVVVNSVLAERAWPGTNPVGRQLRSEMSEPLTVVGVVRYDHCSGPDDPPTECLWFPHQAAQSTGYFRIRTSGDAFDVLPAFRSAARELDERVAVTGATTLGAMVDEALAPERGLALSSLALALFGVLIMAVSCLSLFLSMVKGSRREIAIRMALGAAPERLTLRMVVQGVAVTIPGLLVGVALALTIAPRLAEGTFGVELPGPATLIAVPGVVLLIGLGAVLYAAAVASRTEPLAHLGAD